MMSSEGSELFEIIMELNVDCILTGGEGSETATEDSRSDWSRRQASGDPDNIQ